MNGYHRLPQFIWIGLIAFFLLHGCSSPSFHPDRPFHRIDPIPEGKALVYFYRPPEVQGAELRYPVYRLRPDGKPVRIAVLYNGGYYPYVTKPGEITLYAKSAIRRYRDAIPTQSINFTLKSGDVRFVRTYTGGVAATLGLPKALVQVKPDIGESEIQACSLIPEELFPKPSLEAIPKEWR